MNIKDKYTKREILEFVIEGLTYAKEKELKIKFFSTTFCAAGHFFQKNGLTLFQHRNLFDAISNVSAESFGFYKYGSEGHINDLKIMLEKLLKQEKQNEKS